MIRFVERKNIDDLKWDTAVANSWHETAYGYCWYLDCAAPQWHGLVMDDYEAVMPLTTNKKWGINYIFSVPFLQYTTIFGAEPDNNLLTDFLNAIPKSFKFWDFKLFLPFKPTYSCAKITDKPNLVLDLNLPFSELKKGYNNNTKRNIRSAEKFKVQLREVSNPEEMIDLYKVFKKAKYNTESSPEVYKRFRKLIKQALENGSGKLVYAYTNDQAFLGGTFLQKSKSRILYIFSSATDEARNNGAMFYIVHKEIEALAGENFVLDFEGSEIDGIARFYKGFGANVQTYYSLKLNRLPRMIKWLK